MKTTGTFALLDEELTEDSGSDAQLTFPMRGVAEERYGIVLPRSAGEGVVFNFNFPKANYTAKMAENLELLPGYQYIFHIDLQETDATVSAEIINWEDAPESYYDAVQPSVDAGKSKNVVEGTVMDVFVSEDNMEFSPLGTYTYNSEEKWVPAEPVYWESIDYDPAYMRASIEMVPALNSTQTADLLVSDRRTVARNTGVHFTLTRAVSKLYVDLLSPDGEFTEDQLASAVITLPDFLTGGYLDNGEFVEGTSREDILLTLDQATGSRVAIFQPQSVSTGGTVVRVTINGRTYNAEVESGGYTFEAGVAEHFIIRLYKEDVTISATIVDWEDGLITSWEAVQVSTVAGESHNVAANDKIDLYLLDQSDYNYFTSFVYDGSVWNAAAVKYWEDTPSPAWFIARMDAADALHDSQLPDVLLSEPTRGYDNTGIDFTLTHAATKAVVALTSDTFSEAEMKNATLVLPGYRTGGEFDGAKLVPGTTTGDITLSRTNDISGVAIFEPQTIPAGQTAVRVNFGNNVYEAPAPSGGLDFPAGVATTMIVKYEKGTFSIAATVSDWQADTVRLEALKVIVEEGATDGVRVDEVMDVYYGAQREPLSSYKWNGTNWTSTNPVYWEDLDDPETFYASILRQSAYNSTQPDDYLLSGPTIVSYPNAVNFELKHAVAQVAVRLISSDTTFTQAELNAMDIVLPDYVSGGSYDNGIFNIGSGKIDVVVEKGVGDNNNSALAFVEPQTITATKDVAVVSDGTHDYTVVCPTDIVYRAGYTTVLEIDMRETAVLISARVTDWTEGATISMVPSPIGITGELEGTDGFFVGKTMYVYNLTDGQRYPYTYQGGNWTGSTLSWDDFFDTGLSMTAVYFPYSDYIPAATSGVTSFAWNIETDQSAGWDRRDLLMDHLEYPSGYHTYFNFNFKHVLSRVQVILRSDELTDADLAGTTVTLSNFILDGTANLLTGRIVPSSSVGGTITPYTDIADRQFSAIVMPQTIYKGTEVVSVKLPGYTAPFIGRLVEDSLLFDPGYVTTIYVDIKLTGIDLSANLEKWEDNDSGSVIIQ
ncbi:MAG: fimbrillin family protein [Rikenellaceae bacterium]|nr:fimbrillin family protein [Rikenellaceae bacterium]